MRNSRTVRPCLLILRIEIYYYCELIIIPIHTVEDGAQIEVLIFECVSVISRCAHASLETPAIGEVMVGLFTCSTVSTHPLGTVLADVHFSPLY
jgi:hypothetical protein